MAGFNWDQFEEAKSDSKGGDDFNWDQFENAEKEAPPSRGMEAAAHGFANNMSFGHLPQLRATFRPEVSNPEAMEKMPLEDKLALQRALLNPGDPANQGVADKMRVQHGLQKDDYLGARDKYIKEENTLKAENPMAYGSGEFGGSLATMAVPMGSAVKGVQAAKGLGGFLKTLGIGSLRGGATGGTMAAMANPGDVEGKMNPFQVGERLDNAETGAKVGALVGGGTSTISSFLAKAPGSLKKSANKNAFEALGGTKSANAPAVTNGLDQNIGRQLLDEGAVTFGSAREKIAERVGESVKEKSRTLKDVIETVKSGGGLSPDDLKILEQAKFNPKAAADKLKAEINAEYGLQPSKAQRLGKMVDEQLSHDGPIDIGQAQGLKRLVGKDINKKSWFKDPNMDEETLKRVYGSVKEGIEHNADEYAKLSGQAGGQIKGINQKLGNSIKAQDIVEDRLERDVANRKFGLTDYLAGNAGVGLGAAGGFATGDSLESRMKNAMWGAGAMGANRLARNRGSAALAVTQDKLSNTLSKSKVFNQMATQNPAAFAAMTESLRRKMPTYTEKDDAKPDFISERIPEKEAQDRYQSGN